MVRQASLRCSKRAHIKQEKDPIERGTGVKGRAIETGAKKAIKVVAKKTRKKRLY